jgi:hypothetical protein
VTPTNAAAEVQANYTERIATDGLPIGDEVGVQFNEVQHIHSTLGGVLDFGFKMRLRHWN